jgi:hypothetical protein
LRVERKEQGAVPDLKGKRSESAELRVEREEREAFSGFQLQTSVSGLPSSGFWFPSSTLNSELSTLNCFAMRYTSDIPRKEPP